MGRKHIEVFVVVHEMMFVALIIIIVIVLRVRVIGLRLTKGLGEIDTPLITFDLLPLCLALTPVLRLSLLNLALGKIHLISNR